MPRIETLRIFPWLWIAWCQNDYGVKSEQRLGFTEDQARMRIVARWD